MQQTPIRFHSFLRQLGACCLAICALLLSGCFQTEHTLKINPDGSGTVRLSYFLPAATVAMLADGTEGQPDPYSPEQIRKGFENETRHGVQVVDIQSTETEKGRSMIIDLSFKSLPGLARTELYRESLLSLQRTDDGTFHYSQSAAAPRKIPRAPEELALMRGFVFTMNIEVPGDIVKTNADTRKPRIATWVFAHDVDAGAIQRMDTMHYEIEFTPVSDELPEYKRPSMRLPPPSTHLPIEVPSAP